MRRRPGRRLAGAALGVALLVTPVGPAAADTSCASVLGGDWGQDGETCTATIHSVRNADMQVSVQLPAALASEPAVRTYLRQAVDTQRADAPMMARDSSYRIEYQQFPHSAVTSVVFHEFQQTVGNPPNDAYRSFAFSQGRQLALRDLFKSGIDPLTDLPPLVRPYLVPALDAAAPPHEPGTYPFTVDKFEPQPDGSGFADNYRAFAITPDELILYLPGTPMQHENLRPRDRFVWSMDGGSVVVHVPLTVLAPILAV